MEGTMELSCLFYLLPNSGRFVEVCFAARDGPFLGLHFWGSSSLPSHAGLLLDTLGIVLSKLNAFDRRRDEFDCSETEELDQIQCKVGKSE